MEESLSPDPSPKLHNSSHHHPHPLVFPQPPIMDKSVETFFQTNGFKLTIVLFFWMKTHFSSIVNPLPPKQCCKSLRWCLFVSNIEKGGRGGYLSRRERGEFTSRENMMVISICLNDFCPWLSLTPPGLLKKWLGLLTFEVRSLKGSLKVSLGSSLDYSRFSKHWN